MAAAVARMPRAGGGEMVAAAAGKVGVVDDRHGLFFVLLMLTLVDSWFLLFF